jgi:NAD(P)-dependent dehydrogenase (short-subunit alcohol dehydrogenase family)
VDAKRFNGRIVLITGASSGIGRATAERFAEEGARLALLDRDQAAGLAVKDAIDARGGDCDFHHIDISDESAIISAVNQIQNRFHGLDHIVNSAGITVVKKLEECTAQEWDYVLNVNLRSVFLIAKYALPLLRSSQHPTIVNVASVSSIVAQIGTAAYVASKGGLLMLSKALALDLAEDGIRVNCVCPGITDTPMFRYHMSMETNPMEATQERISRVPLGRALLPREVADAILYLASDQSSGITGTSLVVDAGYTATAEWSRAAVPVRDSNQTTIRDG